MEVTGVYLETLLLLLKVCNVARYVTGAQLARRAGCKATAMNNRLASLERAGLIQSTTFGRERRYTPGVIHTLKVEATDKIGALR